jgi:membrane protein
MIRSSARLLWRAAVRFIDHNGPDRAAILAYYTLLSLLPLLLFLISVGVWLLGSFDAAYQAVLMVFGGVVTPLDEKTLQELHTFVQQANRFQGPGLLLLAWTSRRAFAALLSALERVFDAPPRSFAHGNLLSFSLVLLTGVALLATLALTMITAAVEGALEQLPGPGVQLWLGVRGIFARRVMTSLIAASFFFVVYRFFTRRNLAVGAIDAAIGALLAALLWEIAKAAFAYYVRNLTHYAGLYGALEGVIVLALWLELSASIVLYGAEVVALLVAADKATANSR